MAQLSIHHVFDVELFYFLLNFSFLFTSEVFFSLHAIDEVGKLADCFDRFGFRFRLISFSAILVILIRVWEVRAHLHLHLLLGDLEILLLYEFLLEVFYDL